MKNFLVRGALLCLGTVSLSAIEVEEIVERMEKNQVHDTSYSEGRMIIEDRFGERVSAFIAWNRGEDRTLVEFTSAGEAGQKILRTSNEIYLFYPDAAELIRLQGAALRDSLLGSDVSYEDLTGNRGLLSSYEVSLIGEEPIDGIECYVIDMRARVRDIAYPRQTIWVDKERFVLRRSKQYALSGTLLKVTEVDAVAEMSGKIFPSQMTIRDQLKRDSSTQFILDTIEIDVGLPRGIFSLEQLSF